jgi:hypothetical protein
MLKQSTAVAIVCHSIRATRSTISISIRTLFTVTIASLESIHVYEAQALQSPFGFYAVKPAV